MFRKIRIQSKASELLLYEVGFDIRKAPLLISSLLGEIVKEVVRCGGNEYDVAAQFVAIAANSSESTERGELRFKAMNLSINAVLEATHAAVRATYNQ
jgi:hypothetical protein